MDRPRENVLMNPRSQSMFQFLHQYHNPGDGNKQFSKRLSPINKQKTSPTSSKRKKEFYHKVQAGSHLGNNGGHIVKQINDGLVKIEVFNLSKYNIGDKVVLGMGNNRETSGTIVEVVKNESYLNSYMLVKFDKLASVIDRQIASYEIQASLESSLHLDQRFEVCLTDIVEDLERHELVYSPRQLPYSLKDSTQRQANIERKRKRKRNQPTLQPLNKSLLSRVPDYESIMAKELHDRQLEIQQRQRDLDQFTNQIRLMPKHLDYSVFETVKLPGTYLKLLHHSTANRIIRWYRYQVVSYDQKRLSAALLIQRRYRSHVPRMIRAAKMELLQQKVFSRLFQQLLSRCFFSWVGYTDRTVYIKQQLKAKLCARQRRCFAAWHGEAARCRAIRVKFASRIRWQQLHLRFDRWRHFVCTMQRVKRMALLSTLHQRFSRWATRVAVERVACLVLQTAFRGYHARCVAARRQWLVVSLQALYRGKFTVRNHWVRIRIQLVKRKGNPRAAAFRMQQRIERQQYLERQKQAEQQQQQPGQPLPKHHRAAKRRMNQICPKLERSLLYLVARRRYDRVMEEMVQSSAFLNEADNKCPRCRKIVKKEHFQHLRKCRGKSLLHRGLLRLLFLRPNTINYFRSLR